MTTRFARSFVAVILAGAVAAGCATTPAPPPTQVVRYHLDQPIARGTIAVQPLTPEAGASMAFAPYAAAVQAQLAALGYSIAAPSTVPDFIALAEVRQDQREGPPRPPKFSIGLGVGGGSYGRGGGFGSGGSVGFPVGGGRGNPMLLTDLGVTIKRRADQIAVWEGHARGVVDLRAPNATPDAQAAKLAGALFTGFPGESGRTVEVK